MIFPDCCERIVVLIFFIFHCANTATPENWTSMLSPVVEPDGMNRDTRDGERGGGAVVLSPVVINPYLDSSENLKREYRLEDFLWAGSGEGPMPSDQDGGLAWEDNAPIIGGEGGTDLVIKVTKTTVLFKTVFTTIIPVEMTPAIVFSTISPTPRLITGPELTSTSIYPGFSDSIWPTPTYPVLVSPTAHFPPSPDEDENENDISDNTLKAAAADRMYWVQTIIKANTSIISSIPSFQGMMQKNLARVYASAFKRHLMSNLGILGVNHTKQQQSSSISSNSNHNNQNNNNNNNDNDIPNTLQSSTPAPTLTSIPSPNQNQNISEDNSNDIANDTSDIRKRRKTRRKRSSSTKGEREELDAGWLYLGRHLSPSKMRALATTAMNVTVSILNVTDITSTDNSSQLSLNYIVCAEGNPIHAASAAEDLKLVTKQEMEREIGYEVINKAEALVASPLQETKLEVATSPWLIVAIISIVVMACLVLVIMYMVWNWKNNRLGDTIITPTRTTRPISGIEGGVVNPAFSQTGLGPPSPIERSEVPSLPRSQHQQSQIQIHTASGHHFIKSSATTIKSTSHHKSVDEKSRHLIISQQQPAPSAATVKSQQQALASELNTLLNEKQQHTKSSERVSPSSIKSQSRSEERSLSISSKSSYDEAGQKRTRKHRHKEKDKDKENARDKDKDVSSPEEGSRRKSKEKQITSTAKAKQSPSSSRIRTGLAIHKTRSRTPSPRKKPRRRLDSASSASISFSSQKEAIRRRKKVGSSVEEEEVEVEEEDEILEIQESKKLDSDKERKESRRSQSRSIGEYKSTSDSKSKSQPKSKSISKSKSSKSEDTEKLSSSHFPGRLTIPNLDEHLEGATSRSIDKISYGNLDVCQEAIARPISAKAKKLLPSKSLPSAGTGTGAVVGAGVAADGTSISSSILMEQQEYSQEHLNWRAQLRGKDKSQYKSIDESSEDGKKSLYEQDRDMSDSYEPIDSTEVEPPTKDAQVQTPTRRGKGPSKFRKHQQPKQSSESLISTESEEIIEVHHLDSSSGEGNPMGKMRKRFHQFLDDAFNIMGKKEDDELGRSKSAKVSISHQIETRERKLARPWTSQPEQQSDNEQSIQRLRPKSASFGPPKKAWGTGSERRCHSAKSNASTGSFRGRLWSGASGANSAATIFERGDDSSEQEQDIYDHESTVVSEPIPIHHSTHLPTSTDGRRPYASFTEPIFPNYPIYPDIPISSSGSRIPALSDGGQSQQTQKQQQEKPSDPAVPLILAIKEEIKRFERVKVAEKPPSLHPPSNN